MEVFFDGLDTELPVIWKTRQEEVWQMLIFVSTHINSEAEISQLISCHWVTKTKCRYRSRRIPSSSRPEWCFGVLFCRYWGAFCILVKERGTTQAIILLWGSSDADLRI